MRKDDQICFDLVYLHRRLMQLFRAEVKLATKNLRLTHSQYRILADVYNGVNLIGKLADQNGISQPAMSKVVEGLVRRGILKRTTSTLDRRQIELELTAKGKNIFLGIRKKVFVSLNTRFQDCDQKEIDILQKDTSKILKILNRLYEK